MDCPTCSKTYLDSATQCPYCAAAAGDQEQRPKQLPKRGTDGPSEESWDDSGEDSWESFTSQFNEATIAFDSGASLKKPGPSSSFILPSQATLSSSRADPEPDDSAGNWSALLAQVSEREKPDSPKKSTDPAKATDADKPKSKESQKKAYGRSADVQDAPLHDSWSTGGDSQEKEAPSSNWAAALKAARNPAVDEIPTGKQPLQGTVRPQPPAVEDGPEEEPEDKYEDIYAPPLPARRRSEEFQQAISAPGKKRKGVALFFRLLTALLVLLGVGSLATASYHLYKNRAAVASDSRTPASESTPTDDAGIWLASAQESLNSKDFELAVPQLEKAVGFLKKGKGERGQLKDAQVLLATSYSKTGDYVSCAALWTELAKSNPDLRKRGEAAAEAALRKSRMIANKKVIAGEKAVKNKKYDDAIKLANEALRIYRAAQGQPFQLAQARGVLGDAYREKQNTRVAYWQYTEAGKLDPQGRYLYERSKLKIPVPPRSHKPAEIVKPKFVIKSDVPQAHSRR